MMVPVERVRRVLVGAFTLWVLLVSLVWTREASASPLDLLSGAWAGGGSFKLQDGKTTRIKCNAYYTGGGAQLSMVVRCSGGGDDKIEIRSKLSYSNGRLSGNWEERTYNAEGAASGVATSDHIALHITGGLTGSMRVNFTASHQDVTISTQGIPLKTVNISMTKR